jgi:hypothetical protein
MISIWRSLTAGQWVLRVVMVAGPLLALFARTPSLGAPPAWGVLIVLVLGVGWTLLPESVVGAVALLAVGFSWASSDTTEVSVWVLVAASGLLAAHLAALVASYGPPRLPVDPGVTRLWALRGAGLSGTAAAVWLVARAVADLPDSPTIWILGLVVALSVVVVAAGAIQVASPQEDR